MKTVTAKDFQLHQSKLMKEVAQGTVYRVTYHGKPWIELHPGIKPQGPSAGSMDAFQQSLQIELKSMQLPTQPDYKALRKQSIAEKFSV